MRRQFKERARLVVYVEAADLVLLVARAKAEGKTVVEWARERLLSGAAELGTENFGKGVVRGAEVFGHISGQAESGVRDRRGVGSRRGARRNGGTVGKIEDVTHAAVRKNIGLCKHGARPDLCRYAECRGY